LIPVADTETKSITRADIIAKASHEKGTDPMTTGTTSSRRQSTISSI